MYPTRTYKTMRGLLSACKCPYLEADKFFNAKSVGFLCSRYKDGAHKFWYAKPDDNLRKEIARAFERYHWTRRNAKRLQALESGYWADFMFLHFFQIEADRFSTCLSGEAYDYCRRKFTKSLI